MDGEDGDIARLVGLKKTKINNPTYLLCPPTLFQQLIMDDRMASSFFLMNEAEHRFLGLTVKVCPGLRDFEVANKEGVIYDTKFLR